MSDQAYPNETLRVLCERGSVRHYQKRDIDEEVLAWVLRAASASASGGNLQPWSIVVVREAAKRERLAELCEQKFIGTAPVILLFCVDMRRNRRIAARGLAPYTAHRAFRHFWIAYQDAMIAAQNACVAADSLGLGSCYIGTVVEHLETVSELFGLPEGLVPVELLPLGYPASPIKGRGKFPLEILVHRDRYAETAEEELYEAYQRREGGWTMDATPENLERFRAVCEDCAEPDFAARAVASVEASGKFNAVQYRFGLHYPADEMPRGNAVFVAALKKRGFDIFE